MLTLFKLIMKEVLLYGAYIGVFIAAAVGFAKNVEFSFLPIVFLVSQPNVWYKFYANSLPLGKDIIDILFVATLLGLFFQRRTPAKTTNSVLLFVFIFWTYLCVWNASLTFRLPAPISPASALLLDWKNFAEMIAFYYLALNVPKGREQQMRMLLLMAFVVLFLGIRSYRNFEGGSSFDYSRRASGPFSVCGLGANHFGAFLVDYGAVFLAMSFYSTNWKQKLYLLGAAVAAIPGIMYAFSRGAYLAVGVVLLFFGIVKKRSLLVGLVALVVLWQIVLPASVVDRITMTTDEDGALESSAAGRLLLWQHAERLFLQSPVFGVGYGGFGYTVAPGELTDTHNLFLKFACEQGVIGLSLLVAILLAAFRSGFVLFKHAKDPPFRGLGLGFMGCVLSIVVTNAFGDRFTYTAVGAFFWLLWGTVDRAIMDARTPPPRDAMVDDGPTRIGPTCPARASSPSSRDGQDDSWPHEVRLPTLPQP